MTLKIRDVVEVAERKEIYIEEDDNPYEERSKGFNQAHDLIYNLPIDENKLRAAGWVKTKKRLPTAICPKCQQYAFRIYKECIKDNSHQCCNCQHIFKDVDYIPKSAIQPIVDAYERYESSLKSGVIPRGYSAYKIGQALKQVVEGGEMMCLEQKDFR